jgi:hypothetical protein
MPDESLPSPPPGGQFLVYQTEDGRLKLDVRFEGETVWLTQQHMAELFQTTKQNIGQHLKGIFSEGELSQDSVVKNFFTTAAAGKKYAPTSTTSTPSSLSATASNPVLPPSFASGPRPNWNTTSSKSSPPVRRARWMPISRRR